MSRTNIHSLDIIELLHVDIMRQHVPFLSFSLQTMSVGKYHMLSDNTWIHLKPRQFLHVLTADELDTHYGNETEEQQVK